MEITVTPAGAYTVAGPFPTGTVSLLIGVAGDPFPPESIPLADPATGNFPTAGLVDGTTYWAWVVARDSSGQDIGSDSVGFVFDAGEPPPPPPPEDCADVIAERDALAADLARVRSEVSAEVNRYADAIAQILGG